VNQAPSSKRKKVNAPLYHPDTPALLDIQHITRLLPHRYPFLLLDKIMHLDERTATGIKQVTINEPFFQGHFPGNPTMPGVLQIEALAQAGGVFVLNTVPDPENYWTYFLSIDQCRFRRKVIPGDTLVLHCELLADIKRGLCKMQGHVFVGEHLACEAIMLAQIVKKGKE